MARRPARRRADRGPGSRECIADHRLKCFLSLSLSLSNETPLGQVDRGMQELEVLMCAEHLAREAREAGGAFISILGVGAG